MAVSCDLPAITRRAFFVLALGLPAAVPAAPPTSGGKPPTQYLQFGEPDQEEGRKILEAFRQAGIPGQYYFQFQLRILPRRGEERSLPGQLWGARNEQGAVVRVEVTSQTERRLLLQNGGQAMVWCVDVGGPTTTTRIVDSFEALIPGVELTAFDLQMPYLYWPDAKLERVSRVLGRPAHVFYFKPPAAWAEQHKDIAGVRAYLDTQFNVPVQSELIGQDGRVLRTLSLVDLAKVGDQYIPKTIDLRNERTRDKVRFQVTAAALNLRLTAAVFEPARLTDPVVAPGASQLTRVTP